MNRELRRHFSDKEIVDLTLAIVAINGWNRLAITFHAPAGSYQPRIKPQVANRPLPEPSEHGDGR